MSGKLNLILGNWNLMVAISGPKVWCRAPLLTNTKDCSDLLWGSFAPLCFLGFGVFFSSPPILSFFFRAPFLELKFCSWHTVEHEALVGNSLLFLGLHFLRALVLCVLHSWFLFPLGRGERNWRMFARLPLCSFPTFLAIRARPAFPAAVGVTSWFPAHTVWHRWGFPHEPVVWGPGILWSCIFSSLVSRWNRGDGHGAGREVHWGDRILFT